MSRKTKLAKSNASIPKSCFWMLKGKEACDMLHLWCEETMSANQAKAARAYRYACAYDGVTLTSAYAIGYDDGVLDGADVPIIRNTVRRLVNTFVAKSFANDNPAPQMVSTDGTFEQRLAAEAIDETLMAEFELPQGQFSSLHEMHRHGGTISTCATGNYWVFAFPGEGKVEAELDDGLTVGVVRTGQYGAILTLCRTIWRDPEWLCHRYPAQAADIMRCVETVQSQQRYGDSRVGPTSTARAGAKLQTRRLVKIHQGWRSKIGEEDGLELFCLKNGTELERNVWEHDGPPGRDWCYERELNGEGGVPLTQVVYRMFMRENEMIHDMDRSEHNTPQVMFLCQAGTGEAGALNQQITGASGVKVVEITGDPAKALKVFETPALARNSVQLTEMYNQGQFDITGIGRNQAYGTKQPGTTSGVHESLTASYYTELFADAERRLIQFRAVDCARLFIWALQKVTEDKYSRWVGDQKKRRQLTSKDLDLDESKYVLGIKPASEEKDSPKARIEKAEKLAQDPSGRFTGADLVETWKTFDTDAAADKAYKIESWVSEQCSRWLRSPLEEIGSPGWYQSPMKWMRKPGLESALSVVSYNYLTARQEGAPQKRLAVFEQFMDECVELIEQEIKREAELANTSTRNIFSTNLTPGASNGGTTGGGAPTG